MYNPNLSPPPPIHPPIHPQTALNLIREGHIGIKPAARAFNIPVATLYNAAKRNDISSPMQQVPIGE